MSMFNKFVDMAKKSVDVLEAGIDNTVKSIKEEGLQATSYKIGKQVGTVVNDVQQGVTDYADEIKRANKKATNPVGISFKKGTASHTTAKTVVAAINTMRIIGTDAKNKTNELLEKAEIKKPTI